MLSLCVMAPQSECSLFCSASWILDAKPSTCTTARPLAVKETTAIHQPNATTEKRKGAIREVGDDYTV